MQYRSVKELQASLFQYKASNAQMQSLIQQLGAVVPPPGFEGTM